MNAKLNVPPDGLRTYDAADRYLKTKSYVEIGPNTWLERAGSGIALRLYQTQIAWFYRSGNVSIDVGTYMTRLTFDRLEQVLGVDIWSEGFSKAKGGIVYAIGTEVDRAAFHGRIVMDPDRSFQGWKQWVFDVRKEKAQEDAQVRKFYREYEREHWLDARTETIQL